jgi:4-diphosphocytidyl-2-C-methyl-D-erythritol kinase
MCLLYRILSSNNLILSVFPAYAKINLGLLVLNKRPDGYHNIMTVFHKIDLFDRISFAPSAQVSVISTSPEAPSDESNICHKAARLLCECLKVHEGVRITIEKKIPVGAGLGGGSSDAATVLRHLPAFWGRSAEAGLLHELALELGSDVPYFLGRGSASAQGRGEVLEYFTVDLPFTILLCNPNIHVATGWAYGQLRPPETREQADLKDVIRQGIHDPQTLIERLVNEFEPAVFRTFPEVGKLKEDMYSAGAVYASMSGSGSSVYGLFEDGKEAEDLASRLSTKGYRTFITAPHFLPAD